MFMHLYPYVAFSYLCNEGGKSKTWILNRRLLILPYSSLADNSLLIIREDLNTEKLVTNSKLHDTSSHL